MHQTLPVTALFRFDVLPPAELIVLERLLELQMTIQEGNLQPTLPEFQLGVLLVHGIGRPRRGDTLVRWGDVLLKTIGHATRGEVETTIERAVSSEGLGKSSFEATVRLRTPDHTERWLLAEGRWAEAFPAPRYRELVSWSVRALPWSIGTYVAQRYWQDTSRVGGRKKAVALAWALGQLLVALALAPLLIGVLGLTLLLGLLPISQLRAQIVAMQSTLTATVGDSLAFVESPMRAALIRSCIVDGLDRLKQRGCAHTVIVAHSQGAAATLDALGGFGEPDSKVEASARLLPDALVTFGAGTNQLASQKRLSAGGANPAFVGVIGFVLLTGSVLGLYWLLHTHSLLQLMGDTLLLLGVGVLAGVIYVSLGGAIVWLISWLVVALIRLYELVLSGPSTRESVKATHAVGSVDRLIKKFVSSSVQSDLFRRVFNIVLGITATSAFSVGILLALFKIPDPTFIWFPEEIRERLRLGEFVPERFLLITTVVAVVLVGASIGIILSRQMQTIVSAPVRKPPGLCRWVDLYASADPVPNGSTKTEEGADADESVEIWNVGSFVADHTGYWDNRDGFVLRLVRVCAETAKSPWRDALPRISGFADRRAAWRVSFLRIARWTAGILWLVLGASIWHQMSIQEPFRLTTWLVPAWFPAPLGQRLLFVAAIALVIWASFSVLRWAFSLWARSEQEAVLAHGLPGEATLYRFLILLMGVTVWMPIGAIGVINLFGPELLRDIPTVPGWVIVLLVGLANLMLPGILLGRWPPPSASDPSVGGSTSDL